MPFMPTGFMFIPPFIPGMNAPGVPTFPTPGALGVAFVMASPGGMGMALWGLWGLEAFMLIPAAGPPDSPDAGRGCCDCDPPGGALIPGIIWFLLSIFQIVALYYFSSSSCRIIYSSVENRFFYS